MLENRGPVWRHAPAALGTTLLVAAAVVGTQVALSGAGHPRAPLSPYTDGGFTVGVAAVDRRVSITAADDGSYVLGYTPAGGDVVLDLDLLSGDTVQPWWYEPETGRTLKMRTLGSEGVARFPVPKQGGPAWVLVVDDVAAGYGPPDPDVVAQATGNAGSSSGTSGHAASAISSNGSGSGGSGGSGTASGGSGSGSNGSSSGSNGSAAGSGSSSSGSGADSGGGSGSSGSSSQGSGSGGASSSGGGDSGTTSDQGTGGGSTSSGDATSSDSGSTDQKDSDQSGSDGAGDTSGQGGDEKGQGEKDSSGEKDSQGEKSGGNGNSDGNGKDAEPGADPASGSSPEDGKFGSGQDGKDSPAKPAAQKEQTQQKDQKDQKDQPAPEPVKVEKKADPAPAPQKAAADPAWDKLAKCESSGDWGINTGNGYYGGLQFDSATWSDFGGTEYAPRADKASKEQQIEIASKVRDARGGYSSWPACSSKLGLPK